jgi:thioredoxin
MPQTSGRRFHATRLSLLTAAGLLCLPGCEQSLAPIEGNEVTLTSENFDAEVLQSDLPVLVDFSAPWCGWCQELAPVLAHLSVNYQGRLKVGKVDVDEDPDLNTRFEIEGLPTMLLFDNGKLIATRTGYGDGPTESGLASLSAWVDRYVAADVGAAAPGE